MVTRSRNIRLFMLLICSAALTLGPMGCSSMKPRSKWWQFWRPKQAPSASIYHPDRLIIPPPPDVIGDETASLGESDALAPPAGDGFLIPPAPLEEMTFEEPPAIRGQSANPLNDLQTVLFAYDSSDLNNRARQTLEDNMRWIRNHPSVEIQIEGHCDERGTQEYNLHLGERRAMIVKAFLVSQGAPESKIHTISYGEERPVDLVDLAVNRRAQFLVYGDNTNAYQ